MSLKAEAVIVGGGVAGCSTAYHLAKQGVPSQIIERDAVASQASGKAWAIVAAPASILLFFDGTRAPKGSMRPCLPLFEEGLRRFPQLASELKEEGGIDIGYGELPQIRVVFEESEEEYLKKRVPELQSEGFEVKWIDEDDLKARCPDVTPGFRGGLLFPGQQVEPYQYVLGLLQAAEAKGASMKQGEVVGFRHKGPRVTSVILSTGRDIEADVVVLAMGPWSKQGTSWLGKEIPIVVARAQCLRVEVPPRLPPYRLYNSNVSIMPKVNGTVVLGSSAVPHDEVDFDDRPTEEFKLRTIEAAISLVPRLTEAGVIEHRSGLEGWQPNGALPMLGRLPGWDNVYIAARLGTLGINWSPAVGRIMAELIIKGHTEESVEPFNPARLIGY